jgi:uncharacterized damage-inducible protein DinB
MSTGTHLLLLWQEGRTRFANLLPEISELDLTKKLSPAPNSVGFIIRHVGDVEFLFAKNVFQLPGLDVHAKTVIAQRDTGEWTNLSDLIHYVAQSAEILKRAIESQGEDDWAQTITTKEFGTKTKAECLGRIITHTAYHAGQLKIILKYGQSLT